MPSARKVTHQFVEFVPDEIEDGVLYVSIPYATASHRCCCGCGCEVVTPITPTDWSLIFDGETISLTPSIGNWSFKCESHYWIKKNRVVWSPRWTAEEISGGRSFDAATKESYFGTKPKVADVLGEMIPENPESSIGTWNRIRQWLKL